MRSTILAFLLLAPVLGSAQTYTFSTLLSFPGLASKSAQYPGAPSIDSGGNIYGMSQLGGAHNEGTVFKVTPQGVLSILYSFGATKNDGNEPSGRLTRDSSGNLYGQTFGGGVNASGTIFKLTPSGKETILYSFTGEPAIYADAALARDSAGNLYGYAADPLPNGSVFKLTPSGKYSTLYSFCSLSNCTDGIDPRGGLILKPNGALYGVTYSGGTGNCRGGCGVVFELDMQGHETILHNFTSGGDGENPSATLTQDTAGNLYGSTYYGGLDYGTIFKITAAGQESILYSFCQLSDCLDGEYPEVPVIFDASGNMFGIASEGGDPLFELTPSGVETVIHDGGPAELGYALVMDKAGNMFGTTFGGGRNHLGSVYKLTRQ